MKAFGLALTLAAALCANARADVLVTVDRAHPGAPIAAGWLGVNMGAFEDIAQPSHAATLRRLGANGVRWPGGSFSDLYHWRGHAACAGGFPHASAEFAAFAERVIRPQGLELSLTLNYGSDAACGGGGDAAEAAAWVRAGPS